MSSKRQYPPWDYDCIYKHCCPHLQGLSTHWVFREYQDEPFNNCEHWRIRESQQEELEKAIEYINKIEKENEELKAKLKALHSRQFKANKKKKKDQSGNSQTKKRGAPKGHPGWFRRKPDHIDKTVIVPAPDSCPHCSGTNLTPVDKMKEHLQEDIVLQPRTNVINFKHHQTFCNDCNRVVIQAAKGELLNCPIGPVTKSAAVFLRYGMQIPYRKVQEIFDVFFDMPFVPASAMGFDRSATLKGEAIYDDLKEKLRVSALAHADETSWRQDGINHHLWYAGNNDLGFYHIDRHRSSNVAVSILGDDFRGILNTDGYAAYNAVNAKERQTCLAHIIRKAKEIKQEILLQKPRYHDKHSIQFCDNISELFKNVCEIGQKTNNNVTRKNGRLIKRLYSKLGKICKEPLKVNKVETLRLRLLDPKKEYNRLFTFLKYPGVQPTNNQAEQSLRSMVIFRKICFQTRSDEGSHSHSVLPSLLVTAKRQGKHPLSFLSTLFTEDTAIAQAALYNDSS